MIRLGFILLSLTAGLWAISETAQFMSSATNVFQAVGEH